MSADFQYDIYLAIERGLEASRTLVLCLSPVALGSDWVGLERSTVGRGNCGSRNLRFRDPSNADRRFIPLLLADCKLPDTLRRTAPSAKLPSAASSVSMRRRNCPAKDSNAFAGRSPRERCRGEDESGRTLQFVAVKWN